MIVQIVKVFIKLLYAWWYFPFVKVWRKLDKRSDNVVIVFANCPRNWMQYLYSDSLVADLSLIKAVAELKDNLRIRIGLSNLRVIINCNIFYTISSRFNVPHYRNYTLSILQFIEHMKDQGNRLYPDRDEVIWWENKAFMHRRFDELGVNTPETHIHDLHGGESVPQLEFPFLIKEVHSAGARGIYKIENDLELGKIVGDRGIKERNRFLIVQKLIDIDRDLRVVLVDDEILYHHWRLNDDAEEWEPTTYKKGKKGDFGNFPEEWRDHIIDVFHQIGLTTGAFDMAWKNNDYSQPPYILEISPAYFPNPEPPKSIGKCYGDYKHGITVTNPWEKHYVQQAYRVKKRVVEAYIGRGAHNERGAL